MGDGEGGFVDRARDAPRVAMLVDRSRSDDRAIIRGVVRYARLHGPWRFSVDHHRSQNAVSRLRHWAPTGLIARIDSQDSARSMTTLGCPVVGLDTTQGLPHTENRLESVSEIAADSQAAAVMATDHLLERGYRQVAFVGVPDRLGSATRARAVRGRVEGSGGAMHDYPLPTGAEAGGSEPTRLAEWLSRLPRPIGVVACHDERGRQVLDAARRAGVNVPDEMAVIGIGDDDLLCDVADPPLSSVAFNTETAGFRLAERLDKTMRDRSDQPWRVVFEPTRVVARRSTEVSAVEDPDVAAAMHFIHQHATEKIGVEDIVQPLCMSRRALELRFRSVIGRTLYGELQRVRVERAKRLLIESELSIPRVAQGAGFSSGAYLAQVFRKAVGMTPAEYRKHKRA